mgnify:CR=1 FL=1
MSPLRIAQRAQIFLLNWNESHAPGAARQFVVAESRGGSLLHAFGSSPSRPVAMSPFRLFAQSLNSPFPPVASSPSRLVAEVVHPSPFTLHSR